MQVAAPMRPVRTIGDRIKAAREHLGISQAELAQAAGVSTGTVGNAEANIRKQPRQLNALAEALKVPVRWLEHGGTPAPWMYEQHQDAGSPGLVAQDMSQPRYETAPAKLRVPVIGTLSQGVEKMYHLKAAPDGLPIGHVPAFSKTGLTFAVRVFGDELYPAVRHGQCLVVEPGAQPVEAELALVELEDGNFMVCELVSLRPDSVTFVSAQGGARKTIDRTQVRAVHPVVEVVSASRFEPK